VERFRPGAIAADPSTILYHGRVDARKGALDLLRAVGMLRDWGVGCRVVMSGIGPSYDAAVALTGELGIGDRVEMTGYVDYADVPEVYHRGAVFASPTYAEGFSNTILEAMASGLAVVSCRAVGVVDCIRDGENGLLVEPGDVAGLAGALRRVLTEKGLRARLAGAGLRECRETYSWEAVGRQIMGVYGAVAGEAPDRGWEVALPMTPCRFRAEPHLL